MSEYPALMNDREVSAIIQGRKIAFMRTVSPKVIEKYNRIDPAWQGIEALADDWDKYIVAGYPAYDDDEMRQLLRDLSPYGGPGDTVWVREAHFAAAPKVVDPDHAGHPPYDLWIDGQVPARAEYEGDHVMMGPMALVYRASGKKTWRGRDWRPSYKMWRWACRLELAVESVRLVRIQSIGHEGAMKQGIVHIMGRGYASDGECHNLDAQSAVGALASWWDEMCLQRKGQIGYDANPRVWVVSFRVDVVRAGIVKAGDLTFKELEVAV